jgi:DNA-binding response OmpR family regulator
VTEHDLRRTPKILVADGDRDAADVACLLLSTIGYRVARAYDGWTASALLKVTDPEVAVVNAALPGLGALDLLGEIREGGLRTKVVVASGAALDAFAELSVRARRAGAVKTIPLPFLTHELITTIARCVPAKKPLR